MAGVQRTVAARYVLEAELGAGSGGRVFRGRDAATGDAVAVKLLATAPSGLDAERSTLRSIVHPHLVRVLDAGTDAGQAYLVTELVAGGSLDARPLPLAAEAQEALATQLLDGLAFLHAQGILHGDVKTENVYATPDTPPGFKLGDFGLARLVRAGGRAGTAGSPAFMAPEIVRGEPPDERSDLYALGVTLYEAIFGELPFADADVRQVLLGHLTRTPPRLLSPGETPPRLVRLLRALLEKEPAARPADARQALMLWRGEALATPSWVPPRLGVLVGRDAELELLERAHAEGGAVVSLDGVPGVGKSRLMQELSLRADLRGTAVAAWTPYGLVGRVASTSEVAIPTPEDPQAVAEARARDVRERLGPGRWLLTVDEIDGAPEWFMASLAFLVRDVVEDAVPGQLVCVAGRGAAAVRTREALAAGGLRATAHVELQPWPAAALEAAASALLGSRKLHANLVLLLQTATGSVPAAVEASCRRLAREGLLRLDATAALTVASEVRPEDIVDTGDDVLEQCDASQIDLLRLLAALRTPASLPFLIAFDAGAETRLAGLRGLGVVTIVRAHDAPHFAVASEAVRQSVLHATEAGVLRQVHDRIAAALESAPGLSPDEDAALHRALGAGWPAARHALATLAARPRADVRPETLREAHESVLALWPEDDDAAARAQVEVACLDVLVRLGDFEAVETAVAGWRDRAGADVAALLCRLAATYSMRGNPERVLEILANEPRTEQAAELHVLRADALRQMERFEAALLACDATLPQAAASDPLRARAQNIRARILIDKGDFDAARSILESAVVQHQDAAEAMLLARDVLELGHLEFRRGDLVGARAHLEEAHGLYTRLGDRFGTQRALNSLGVIAAETGSYDEAREYFQRTLDHCRRLGQVPMSSHLLGNLGQLACTQARYRDALAYTQEAKDLAAAGGLESTLQSTRVILGGIHAALNQEAPCHAELEALMERGGEDANAGMTAILWCDLALRREDVEAARPLLARSEAIFSRRAADERVHVDLLRSRLAELEGDLGAAHAAARRAAERARELSLRGGVLEAEARYAELLRESDPAAAEALSVEDLAEARVMGLPEMVWRFERLLGRLAWARGDFAAAALRYERSIDILRAICDEVPEAALEDYLAHPERRRLFDELDRLRAAIEGS